MPQRGPVFGVLGPLLLSVDGRAVPIGTPKQRAVMASLVMNRNRPVAADSLINAVWGEDAPSEARASLHAYVSNLRRLLGTVGFDGKSMLEKVSPGYRLNIGELDVDLGRFIRARNEGVKAATAGRFDEASRHYSAALAQWRGDVLDDLRGFDFVSVFATAMADEKIATHIALAESEIACGRAKRITGELEAACRRTSVPGAGLGAADDRVLRLGAAVGCPRCVSAAEDHSGRRTRYRPEPATAGPS